MRTIDTDIAIIGAGIAGAGVAAELAGDFKVVLAEQEDCAGYHSTGRSAAIFIRNYGNATIRALSNASAPLFEGADRALFPQPLLTQRGLLYVAGADGVDKHRELITSADGLCEIDAGAAVAKVPVLRRETIAAAAYEKDARDITWRRFTRAGCARRAPPAPACSPARRCCAQPMRAATGGSRRRRFASRQKSSSTPPAPGPIKWRSGAAWQRSG